MFRKIGIICPTAEEATYIHSCMAAQRKVHIGRPASKILAFTGEINGLSTCLCICGFPKQASIYATALILNLGVDAVICVGSAGGLTEKIKTGDIVVASDIVFHDADPGVGGVERGTIIDGDGNHMFSFPVNDALLSCCESAAKEIASRRQVDSHTGRVLSGDQFISALPIIESLKDRFAIFKGDSDKAPPLCADMESGGVALAGTLLSTPFGAIRIINNQVDKPDGIDNYLQWKAISAPRDIYELVEATTLEIRNKNEIPKESN